MFRPKIIETMKEYSTAQLTNDIIAGIIVGIIAIPLSIALAISSGVSPEQGLYTAVIAGFLTALFGGSRVQIGGPTGAFVVIIYGIILKFGYQGLVMATLMAGAILIVMGILRFGSIIRFIPCTITTGFTSGIALVIFSQQLNDFLGLEIPKVPAEFIDKMHAIITNLPRINFYSLGIGALTCNVGLLELSTAGVEMIVDIRYPVTANPEEICSIIRDKCEAFGLKVDDIVDNPPLYVDKNSVLVSTLLNVYNETKSSDAKPVAIGGGTYARSIPNIVAFGPNFTKEDDVAHQAGEYIKLDDLFLCQEIYKKAIKALAIVATNSNN